jgi:hypothetical protein
MLRDWAACSETGNTSLERTWMQLETRCMGAVRDDLSRDESLTTSRLVTIARREA